MKAETSGSVTVLALSGELDVTTSDDLMVHAALVMPAQPGRLILDLSDLAFTDCQGARTLAALADSSVRPTIVRGARPRVRRVLHLLGLTRSVRAPRQR
ncbi:MAG TPA: STAS domain-containing protein [Trebonia sp.]